MVIGAVLMIVLGVVASKIMGNGDDVHDGFVGGDGGGADVYTDALLEADKFEQYGTSQIDEAARHETCEVMGAAHGNLTYNMLYDHNLHNGTMWDGRTGSAYVEWLGQSQSCRGYATDDDYRLGE